MLACATTLGGETVLVNVNGGQRARAGAGTTRDNAEDMASITGVEGVQTAGTDG